MKLKFDIQSVFINRVSVESWLRYNKKKADQSCNQCKTPYQLGNSIAYLRGQNKKGHSITKFTCADCAKLYIEAGAEDTGAIITANQNKKQALIDAIETLGYYRGWTARTYPLAKMNVEELNERLSLDTAKKTEEDRISTISFTPEELEFEPYLKEDYGVIQEKWLVDPEQFRDYLSDEIGELLECGQGYSQNEGSVIIKLGLQFYQVDFTAEINSSKQDRGDRLYWVEDLDTVSWKEIDKPEPKAKGIRQYEFFMNNDEHERLVNLLDKHKFEYSLY